MKVEYENEKQKEAESDSPASKGKRKAELGSDPARDALQASQGHTGGSGEPGGGQMKRRSPDGPRQKPVLPRDRK